MGKKVKKKARASQKEKLVTSDSPKKKEVVVGSSDPSIENNDGDDSGVSVVKVKKACCPHIEKGVDLNKLRDKFGSPGAVKCEDCRESTIDRKGGKGKGKHANKKDSKSVWLCLECGHFVCGGVGLPINPDCHAIRHVRQTRHPLVVKFENPQFRWCFPCNTQITVDKTEEKGEEKDVFSEVVKLIKGHSLEDSSGDVEDVWFGSGSVLNEIKSAGNTSSGSSLSNGRGDYVVRGLANLGNTCFFNSILQNLLAIGRLRDHFLNFEAPSGALAVSLKKLFTDTKSESGLKNVISPKSFFGCICSKAPQFRGYQQQDSHELLRCLLDGLCTEESSSRKSISTAPKFVDDLFGGKISSTVRCVECDHSSTVYESFLDLSLPVPTRKSLPKASQPNSRAKKTKLPPKRAGKVQSKINKDKNPVESSSLATPSTSCDNSNEVQSNPTGLNVSDRPTELNIPEQSTSSGLVLKDVPALQESEHGQVCEDAAGEQQASASSNDFAWMDYLDDGSMLDDCYSAAEDSVVSIVQNSKDINTSLIDVSLQRGSDFCEKDIKVTGDQDAKPIFLSLNSVDDELPSQVQGCEILLLPYKEGHISEVSLLPHKDECSITEENVGGEGEASSSAAGWGQDDFDGLGDLFHEPEPEVFAGPCPRPLTVDEGTQVSVEVSESDPDEVDDTNSPVSVESCLAHFIKPELLANENAWHCENCSKSMTCQNLEAKKRHKARTYCLINGCETKAQTGVSLSSDTSEINCISNGHIESNHSGEDLVLIGGKMNYSNENCTSIENAVSDKINPVCQQLEGNAQIKDVSPTEPNNSESNNSYALERIGTQASEIAGCLSENSLQTTSKELADCSSKASEDEVVNSKHMIVKRDAIKRVVIDRAPPILTIHLKRFSHDVRGRLSKLNGHVIFREAFDLGPYMDSRSEEKEKYEYHLIGVVEHSGTMKGGHYIAYVKGGKRSKAKAENEKLDHAWYYASDAHVREVSLDEVLQCEAYILFYEKT